MVSDEEVVVATTYTTDTWLNPKGQELAMFVFNHLMPDGSHRVAILTNELPLIISDLLKCAAHLGLDNPGEG